MTKHDAISEYFKPKIAELADDILHFNFSPESPDSVALVTNYAEQVIKKFVTGDARKAYGFSVIIVKSYSTGGDDLNLECMNFVQTFMDWLEEQNKSKNYPDFPENCTIESMDVMQNMPNLAGVNAEEGLARYMVQCRIIYIEHEKDMLGL